jgi:hypothetical protein
VHLKRTLRVLFFPTPSRRVGKTSGEREESRYPKNGDTGEEVRAAAFGCGQAGEEDPP